MLIETDWFGLNFLLYKKLEVFMVHRLNSSEENQNIFSIYRGDVQYLCQG